MDPADAPAAQRVFCYVGYSRVSRAPAGGLCCTGRCTSPMTFEPHPLEPPQSATAPSDAALRFLRSSADPARIQRPFEQSRALHRTDRTARRYRRADGRGVSRGHALRGRWTRPPRTGAGASRRRRRQCRRPACHQRAVSGSHRARRSHQESGNAGTPGAAAWTLGGSRSLRAGGVSHRLAAARGLGRDRRERRVCRRGADRAAGAWQAVRHPLRPALRGRADWRGDWRPGDSSGWTETPGLC